MVDAPRRGNPRVSVLMPVYNSAAYLAAAIDSVVTQSFRDWELLIIDDGSDDGSAHVAAAKARSDSRINVTSRENRGLIATRNELLAAARGEFVAWVDSDDIAHPDRFQRQLDYLTLHPDHVCVGSDARQIDPDGRRLACERYPVDDAGIRAEQRSGGGIRFPTTMMRRDAVAKAGPFREPFRIGEDFDLLLRLGEVGLLGNIAEELYLYRQHPNSTVATLGDHWFLYRDAILSLAEQRRLEGSDHLQRGGSIDLPTTRPTSASGKIVQSYRHWASQLLQEDRPLDASRYVLKALRMAPLDRALWKMAAKLIAAVPGRLLSRRG